MSTILLHSTLNISQTVRDRGSVPKEHQLVMRPMTSRDPQRCCEAVRWAILATAWLLVSRCVPIYGSCIAVTQQLMFCFVLCWCRTTQL